MFPEDCGLDGCFLSITSIIRLLDSSRGNFRKPWASIGSAHIARQGNYLKVLLEK